MYNNLKNWVYLKEDKCYYQEHVPYCLNPTNPELQCMNIYVPEQYLNMDGTFNNSGNVKNTNEYVYTAFTAPILYWNNIGGYAQCRPVSPTDEFMGTRLLDIYKEYLAEGYVVVSPGSRGKDTVLENGYFTGKAQNIIADLKAGIRFLRAIKGHIPGDTEKIITVGVSAGGAASALLGVTGNSVYYKDALVSIGAVMNERDDVFASQCYCPIIDLENSDISYEWMYGNSGDDWHFLMNSGTLTPFQKELSKDLAKAFPAYINSKGYIDKHGNPLQLDGVRSGSYYSYLMDKINDSLNNYLNVQLQTQEERLAAVAKLNEKNVWVFYKDDRYEVRDLDSFTNNYSRRIKSCPADDGLDRFASGMPAQGEMLGTDDGKLTHYSIFNAQILKDNANVYKDIEGFQSEYVEDYQEARGEDVKWRCYLMNPMNFIENQEVSDKARFFRICVGSLDADESFTISMNLDLALKKHTDVKTKHELIWGSGHGVADYPGQLIQWLNKICAVSMVSA